MNGTAVEKYLSDLATELRKRGVFATRFMEETRGHLADAVEAGQRRGLAPEAAAEEAIQLYGDARTVAKKFAAEKYRTLHWALLIAAVTIGLAIAWVDSRPHWDDSGITAGSLLLSAGVLGLICLLYTSGACRERPDERRRAADDRGVPDVRAAQRIAGAVQSVRVLPG